MVQPVPTKVILQLAKAATMCKRIENHNLQNGLCQLITCGKCQTTPKVSSVVKGLNWMYTIHFIQMLKINGLF